MINDIIMIHIVLCIFYPHNWQSFTVYIYNENKYIYINNTCVSNVVVCMVAHADIFFNINIDFR